MKRTPIVSMVAFLLLSVFLVSCGMQQAMTDDDFDGQAGGRRQFYNNNPWMGPNTIIIERDPFTGRYYQVAPGGLYAPLGYDPWLFNPGPRVIAPRGGGWYNGPRVQRGVNNPAPPQRQEAQRQNDAAREQILGPRRSN